MVKGTIHKEDITFINILASIMGAPKYIKELLKDLKRKTISPHNSRGLYHLQQWICHIDRESQRQEIMALNKTLDQMDLLGLNKLCSPKVAEHTLLKCMSNFLKNRT